MSADSKEQKPCVADTDKTHQLSPKHLRRSAALVKQRLVGSNPTGGSHKNETMVS